jgi:hypothetical protein
MAQEWYVVEVALCVCYVCVFVVFVWRQYVCIHLAFYRFD